MLEGLGLRLGEETSWETQLFTGAETAEAAAYSHVADNMGLQSCQMSDSSKVCHCLSPEKTGCIQEGDF